MVFSVREGGGWSSSEYVMKINQSNLNIKQKFKSYIVIFQVKKNLRFIFEFKWFKMIGSYIWE